MPSRSRLLDDGEPAARPIRHLTEVGKARVASLRRPPDAAEPLGQQVPHALGPQEVHVVARPVGVLGIRHDPERLSPTLDHVPARAVGELEPLVGPQHEEYRCQLLSVGSQGVGGSWGSVLGPVAQSQVGRREREAVVLAEVVLEADGPFRAILDDGQPLVGTREVGAVGLDHGVRIAPPCVEPWEGVVHDHPDAYACRQKRVDLGPHRLGHGGMGQRYGVLAIPIRLGGMEAVHRGPVRVHIPRPAAGQILGIA